MEKRKTRRERNAILYESMDLHKAYGPCIIQEEIKSIAGKNSDPFVCINYGICNVSAACALGKYCIMHTTCA